MFFALAGVSPSRSSGSLPSITPAVGASTYPPGSNTHLEQLPRVRQPGPASVGDRRASWYPCALRWEELSPARPGMDQRAFMAVVASSCVLAALVALVTHSWVRKAPSPKETEARRRIEKGVI